MFDFSSWLAFLIMADPIYLMWHFVLQWVICVEDDLFVQIHFFLISNFRGFLSVPHFVDIYAKNMDERGRNFVFERILPSLPVLYQLQRSIFDGSLVHCHYFSDHKESIVAIYLEFDWIIESPRKKINGLK